MVKLAARRAWARAYGRVYPPAPRPHASFSKPGFVALIAIAICAAAWAVLIALVVLLLHR